MVAVLSGIVIFILAIWEILSPQQVVTRFVQNEVYTLFKTLYASDVFITLLSSAFFILTSRTLSDSDDKWGYKFLL